MADAHVMRQARQRVNAPGDRFEREANAVADAVVAGERSRTQVSTRTGADGVQAKCAECEKEEDGERKVQRKAITSVSAPAASGGAGAVVPNGGGAGLPRATQAMMESRIGHDFSHVRVHTGGAAAQSARQLNARAYTSGRDVVFGAGEYRPGTTEGDRLIAHELTHVVQQGGVARALVQRQDEPSSEYPGFTEEEVGEYSHTNELKYADTSEDARTQGLGRKNAAVRKPGRMSREQYLLVNATSDRSKANIRTTLEFNAVVFVEEAITDYYLIRTESGITGWVPSVAVALDPPEPNAVLYKVQEGDKPIDLVARWYKPPSGFSRWWTPGSEGEGDARFYVAALAFANKGRAGMPSPDDLSKVDAWKEVKVIEGLTIWRPSAEFLRSLQGKVSSGSITKEIWETVESAVKVVWEWVTFGAAFVAGVIAGALESLWDLLTGLVDLLKMIWDLLVSIFTGNLLNDLKELWDNIKNMSLSQMAEDFMKKWNAPSPWDSGFFRGRVVGYIIMEIITAIFTGGSATAVKWAGKFGKIAKVLSEAGKLAKITERVKNVVKAEKLVEKLGSGAEKLKNVMKGSRAATVVDKAAEITKGVEKGRPAIDAAMKTTQYLADRAAAYKKYAARGGKKAQAVWEKMYDTLYRNREVGRLAEKEFQNVMGGAPKSYEVMLRGKKTTRNVDNVLGNTAREIKSGPLELTPFIKDQILKDIELMKLKKAEGFVVEWHLLAGGDPAAIAALKKAGINVVVY